MPPGTVCLGILACWLCSCCVADLCSADWAKKKMAGVNLFAVISLNPQPHLFINFLASLYTNAEIHKLHYHSTASVLQALLWRTVYCCYLVCSRTMPPTRTSSRRAATFNASRSFSSWTMQQHRPNKWGGQRRKWPTFTSCCSWFEPWSPPATPRTRLWPVRNSWTSVVSGIIGTTSVQAWLWIAFFLFYSLTR